MAVTIRRATPADAADVAAMVREIAAHEDQSAHVHVDDDRWRSPDQLLIRWAWRRTTSPSAAYADLTASLASARSAD